MALYNELLELSAKVEKACAIKSYSNIVSDIELSDDIILPYTFTCEALHPGTFKGYRIPEDEIVKAQNSIFNSFGNFHNNEINKDHKNSRKEESSVDDLVGRVIDAKYDFAKTAYILKGEVYDKSVALKIANGLLKYVSLRISPGTVQYENGEQVARDLEFQELSFVRVPGDDDAHIYNN